MTALPPAGWYPDPESGGTTWRWWDGVHWAAPTPPVGPMFGYGYGAAPAFMQERYRDATAKFGRWLRWAMVANVVSTLALSIGFALVFHGDGFHLFSNDPYGQPNVSGGMVAIQLASIPLNFVTVGYVGSLIAWIYQAGNFADTRGWPAARSRSLGAFSVFIPVVNLWWPYEAVRDSFPPGAASRSLLTWWVSYLVAPAFAIPVFLLVFVGSPVQIAIAIVIAACALPVPVWFGWKVIRDLEVAQRSA